jgi:hypothetical protein
MANYAQGKFVPKNPAKYVGKHEPRYRSGWELSFMNFCDSNKNILYWASEALIIPYRHPITGKKTNYIPDFFVVYENKNGMKIAEVVEIKPKKQSLIESRAASAKDKLVVAINHAKWQAAMAYCKQQGYTFRVITEDDLFYNGRKR